MDRRQREVEDIPAPPAIGSPSSEGIGSRGRTLLDGVDDALDWAVSSDSRQFQRANVQTGGQ